MRSTFSAARKPLWSPLNKSHDAHAAHVTENACDPIGAGGTDRPGLGARRQRQDASGADLTVGNHDGGPADVERHGVGS